MRSRIRSIVSIGIVGFVLGSGLESAQARPRLRPLRIRDADTLFRPGVTGPGSFPRLNDRNQIAFTMFESGKLVSRLWEAGHLSATGNQGGYSRMVARGLNDSGQVVGEVQYRSGGEHYHGFEATLQNVNILPINPQAHIDTFCTGATVYDINEQGAASGWSSYAFAPGFALHRPVVWQSGGLIESGTIGAHPADSQDFHWPVSINNSGTIAGTVHLFYSAFWQHYHGYYGPPGAVTEVQPFAGGNAVFIWDINDSGLLAGESNGSWGSSHAMLVSGGQKKDIHGTVFANNTHSAAYAINDSGVAVGWWLGGRGLYHANDTTWLIDSLLSTRFFPDGGIARLFEAVDINNQGVVLALYEGPGGFSYPCLLVPVDSGTIVNTENDLPDLNPADGRCYTGNVTAVGEDECSFRAALQHSNAHAGLDSIRFKIPVSGVPQIAVGSPLPAVMERVVIDATTQPGVARVEVIPEDSTVGGDGLTLSSGRSTVRGLLLNGFAQSGLVLQSGDSNSVEACHFGVRADSVTPAGNGSHGIRISNSDGNQIGSGFDEDANLIAFNEGAGIYVESGTANTFSRNIYHHNGGLGIDLAPAGPNPNDSLDSDGGANHGVNYPTVDSAIAGVGSTLLYGTLVAERQVPYVVEISMSDSCDTSGYGEGEEAVWSTVATTNADGVAHFSTTVPVVLDSGQVFTLTATDTAKSTSEFGPCWPNKWLRLLESTGSPIANKSFALSRVAFDPPDFTETLLDSVVTDGQGRVDLGRFYLDRSLSAGDSVKLLRRLTTFARGKTALPSPGRALTIYLDNGRFDSSTSELSFDELSRAPRQDVHMRHTTLGVNLVISVEWETDSLYLEMLGSGIYDLCNYLYDVTDGQLRLDTVWIYGHRMFWGHTDVRVWASNSLQPKALLSGMFRDTRDAYLNMSRRWFGMDEQPAADSSYAEWPMRPDDITNYRTIGHELGHYALGLLDEYFEMPSERCMSSHRYGFMDSQYPGNEPSASEMSWDRQYPSEACKNTEQWEAREKSCWNFFESRYQNSYNGVFAEILRPDERNSPGSPDHFSGPNDLQVGVQVDVGARTEVRLLHLARSSRDFPLTVRAGAGQAPVPGTDVTTWHQTSGRKMIQGLTSSTGQIHLLGVKSGDSLFASKGAIRQGISLAAAAVDTDFIWYSAAHELPGGLGDSLQLELAPAAGYLPAMCELTPGSGNATLTLLRESAFGADPQLEFWSDPDSGAPVLLSMPASANHYVVNLPVDSDYVGTAIVRALDTLAQPFFFPIHLVVALKAIADTQVTVSSLDGSCALEAPQLSSDGRIALCTTPYLPLRTGLPSEARQGGHAVSFGASPLGILGGPARLSISYSDADLATTAPPFDDELTLKIFRWDDLAASWTAVGGEVDSAEDRITAEIVTPGVYAAFTTGQAADVGDDDLGVIIPDRYELWQNHPNPFNPSTTISYYLPRPSRVMLRIHNVLGQTVRTLVDEVRQAGRHDVVWDGRTTAGDPAGSGVYFYTLRAGDATLTRKMVLMK